MNQRNKRNQIVLQQGLIVGYRLLSLANPELYLVLFCFCLGGGGGQHFELNKQMQKRERKKGIP